MQTIDLYRYQLLPLSQHQQELFSKSFTAEEIRARKNDFFAGIFRRIPSLVHRGVLIRHKEEYLQDDTFIFKLGAHKSVDRDNEEFQKEKIESWPNVTVFIYNRPDTQVIAISRNYRAFSSTKSVATILERTFNSSLREYGLTIQILEQFEKKNFWNVVKKYEGSLTRVRFEMISPNMANLSRVLKVDLKQLNRESNSQKTNLELQAIDGAALEINESNELINGCVEYSSMGAGDIAIKIRGIRKEIRTSETVKSIEIDEMTFEGSNENLIEAVKQVLTR